MKTFAELGLSTPLLEALERLGYQQPTPIQEETIPLLLGGSDVIGQAQTGTGKTAAFGLPMLEFVDPGDPEVQALVLTPTRELCIQVTQALRAYGEQRGISVVAVFGGAPIRDQASRLKENAQVVVGTVGRVMDMIGRHYLFLDSARYVVLDEADEMLDLGFLEDVETILGRCPSGRQTALFSATIPREIRELAEKRMYEPVTVKVKAATLTIDTVAQFHVEVSDRDKPEKLAEVIAAESPEQAIIFARTKIGVDRLARRLGDKGLRVKTLHGDMSQGSRDGVMIAFKGGRERLLVATDVAARGLDIAGVSHIVNYDVPNSPDIYVHRIGRTGRAGETGRAITFITPKQRSDLEAIERHAQTEIKAWGTNGGAPAKGQERSDPSSAGGAQPERQGRSAAGTLPEERRPIVDRPSTARMALRRAPDPPFSGEHRTGDSPVEEAPLVEAPAPGGDTRPADTEEKPSELSGARRDPGRREAGQREPRQTRRPRHTKPRRELQGDTVKLIVGAGRQKGIEPADVVAAIVDGSHLDGEDVRNVRVLERFSFVEVPAERAQEVVDQVTGNEVRGVELRLEVAKR